MRPAQLTFSILRTEVGKSTIALHRDIVAVAAVFSLGLLSACGRGAFPDVPPGYREFAYVANSSTNTVSVLDLVYLRTDRTLRVGEGPVALAANPIRDEVYSVNRRSASISVIDIRTNWVSGTIPVHRQPTDIAVAPDGRRAFVTNSAAKSVSILDLDARREIATVATAGEPSRLRLAPDARSLAIANSDSGSVSIYTVAPTSPSSSGPPLQLRAIFPGCPGASDLSILPDSSKIFIACSLGHQVMAISLAAAPESWLAQQNPSLKADHFLTMLDVGLLPTHLALKPDGGEIFVSNSGSDSISEISTPSNEVGGTYTIASHPGDAIVGSDDSTLWIANSTADNLGIYSIDDGRLTGSVRTGSAPEALAFSADEHLLLATNTRSGDIALIRTAGRSGPALFTMLPAGGGPAAIVTKVVIHKS